MSKECLALKIDVALGAYVGGKVYGVWVAAKCVGGPKTFKKWRLGARSFAGGVASSPSNTVPLGRSTRLSEKTASNKRTMPPDPRTARRRERTRSQPRFEL